MTNEEWLPVPLHPKPDEPISYEDWVVREERRRRMDSRTIAHIEVVFRRERERHLDEIIDIATGRGTINDGLCPNAED